LRIPRDLGGQELAVLLRRYGYEVIRQTGSHLRLVSKIRGSEHHITIPVHRSIRVGTLGEILSDVASYLKVDRARLLDELFGR
jgi:predicted RNA binding protein YcfA (HicA-like mRNA interferase family)